jgi:hypothetical protein
MQNENKLVSYEELIISNMVEIQAIVRILKRRNILNEEELLEEVENLQAEMSDLIRKMSKEN